MIEVKKVNKSFTLFNQNNAKITVFKNLNFKVNPGEIVALKGPSGIGKSSILKMIYGSYIIDKGAIIINNKNIATLSAQEILKLRKTSIGYVSQFLKVIPRISALDVIMEPLLNSGDNKNNAYKKSIKLLKDLNIEKNLWHLSPLTFSGGEQQRINIARGFIKDLPYLLLDEPTASLDSRNRDIIINLIKEKSNRGVSIIGIFHDEYSRKKLNVREIDLNIETKH